MFPATNREWLEAVTVPVGGEASWRGGELRLWFDDLGLERGVFARLLGIDTEPEGCRLSLHLATRDRPRFPYRSAVAFPAGFPLICGPFHDDGPLFAAERAALFEIRALDHRQGRAHVRAGYEVSPPDIDVHGDLSALDPEAQRFIRWWVELPGSLRRSGTTERVFAWTEIQGFRITLSPRISGAPNVTFHREGRRFFVRTIGGCVVSKEDWYGPFVVRGDAYELEA